MIVTVNKIGIGTDDNPIRPDTVAKSWILLSETEKTMTIEVLDN